MRLQYPDVALVAGSVRVRPWRDDDLGCVEAAATDPNIPAGTTVPAVFTPRAGLAFLRRQRSRLVDGDGISQAITDAGTDDAVGLIYLDHRPQRWIAGLGYWLVPAARGQHRATAAVRLVTDWALEQLDIMRIEAWVTPDNSQSRRVMERTGFTNEGTLRNFLQMAGRTTDAIVYSRVP